MSDPIEPPEIAPMPVDPPAVGACPHCGAPLRTGAAGHAAEEDAGVCAECLGLCIAMAPGWRVPSYDEAEAWDQDPRIKAMRAIWAKDLPGPEVPK